MYRIGFGYDSHRFKEGNGLVIGGVNIPYSKSFVAHSDGDLLIHALCDALLGAAALKDIGTHFSDNDPQYYQIDSTILLNKTVQLLHQQNWEINNIDTVVVIEKPALAPYIDKMTNRLADLLKIPSSSISIKAKSNEKMGFIGKEEGAAAFATVTIFKL